MNWMLGTMACLLVSILYQVHVMKEELRNLERELSDIAEGIRNEAAEKVKREIFDEA